MKSSHQEFHGTIIESDTEGTEVETAMSISQKHGTLEAIAGAARSFRQRILTVLTMSLVH